MRRAGLRSRITALFALGALGLCTALGLATYELTKRTLLSDRERTAVRAAYVDAEAVQAGLSADDPIVSVLRNVDTGPTRRAVIWRDGRFYARSAEPGITDAVPAALQELALEGRAGRQRSRLDGRTVLVAMVPLPEVQATYYEINDLEELERTLSSLFLVLVVAALATAAGGAAVGRWASGRVLRPLSSVEQAATRISAGDLSTRLDAGREPDLSRLAVAFNGMVDDLSVRLDRDRRFAADVSHELRSPLQTLSAAAEVLERRRTSLDERSAAAVGLMTKEVSRFQQLVTDLLELAKGERPPTLGDVDVASLVRGVAQERRVPVELTGDLTVQGDARRLRQVLTNLLDNAEQHGGGAVAVRAVRCPRTVQVEVDDEGPGVPEAERELVFDRFGRGRTSGVRGSREGTGLGLALVAQHVQAHGGRVHVSDRPGGGARFTVELPA